MFRSNSVGKSKAGLVCGTVLALSVYTVSAAAAEKITELKHSVYVGGLFLGSIDTEIGEENNNYRIESIANTSKTFDWAFKWIAKGKTVGLIDDDKISPFLHRHESSWNKNVRSATMNYDPSGSVEVETTGKISSDPNKYTPIDPGSLTNSIDPMSAMLLVSNRLESGQGCNAEVAVFDGRRRYDVKLTEKDSRLFKPSRYSVFAGEAIGCKIDIVKKGGFKKGQDNYDRMNQEIVVWAAAPVAGARVVPVRMQVSTDFGRMELHLEEYHEGPIQLVSRNAK
ncbi:DUF3108 domain-containing protein [Sneathiella marina]|uniref:DUF3108 domain-containing protein n=1 Tax=Sneathiella marina TaxID=2950108 RepID=A0ABY4W0N9_9PROT|nr:DUF3108 domain-containing protein [Sneathiella marina]USG60436.1 DUF3108 domain-containing protein [Sneathiella marina]